jgi:hypothetical protein
MVMALGALLLAAAVVFFVLQPLVAGQSAPLGRSDDEMSEVESRRRVKLLALRDVEMDFVTGKLDNEDYRSLKRELSAEALDALHATEREEQGLGTAALEAEIAEVRRTLASGVSCGGCGHVNPSGSRFCSTCGSRLEEAPAGSGVAGSGGAE